MPNATIPDDLECLRLLVDDGLRPMLSGAQCADAEPAPVIAQTVIELGSTLLVRTHDTYPYVIPLKRPQRFSAEEVNLAKAFMHEASLILSTHAQPYYPDLKRTIVRKAIARALNYLDPHLLLKVIDHFDSLSAQTYEGQRIVASIGLEEIEWRDGYTLEEVWKEDFSKVLTSGVDTMLTVSPQGYVYQFQDFDAAQHLSYAPNHFRLIADWATGRRVGCVLNRSGEILLFKEKSLLFARRRGAWVHFDHEAIIKQFGKIGSDALRRSVYETCLDVSFARSGGCIAIAKSSTTKAAINELISANDILLNAGSCKSASVANLVSNSSFKGTTFNELPRRFRQELAAIDGATILDHNGEILAVGAIVKVPGGSESGARRAAAKALATLGVGIKISTDGAIAGFLPDSQSGKPMLAFEFA